MAASVPNKITRNMAGSAVGSLISLPRPARQIRITCSGGGVARVRAQKLPAFGSYTAPTAPQADPLPAGGNNMAGGWVPLNSGDSTTNVLVLDGGYYQPVEIWEVTPGTLVCEGVA